MKLQLLSRPECGLCREAAAVLSDLGLRFETVDVDSDPRLALEYGERIPVVLLDGREVARAPVSRESLRSALGRVTDRQTAR